jgi:hypothetical protein
MGYKESFDNEFCEHLEYHLTRTFRNSGDEEMNKLWCDGVIVPDSRQLNKATVNIKRRIETKVWLGSDGQTQFELIIRFGDNSIKKYLEGESLVNCVPSDNSIDWLTLDLKEKNIELRLK